MVKENVRHEILVCSSSNEIRRVRAAACRGGSGGNVVQAREGQGGGHERKDQACRKEEFPLESLAWWLKGPL